MSALTIFKFENTPTQTIVENNEIFFRETRHYIRKEKPLNPTK